MTQIQWWRGDRIAEEIFGVRDAQERRRIMNLLATTASRGTTAYRYKQIGSRWFYDPTSFTADVPPPKHPGGRRRKMDIFLGIDRSKPDS